MGLAEHGDIGVAIFTKSVVNSVRSQRRANFWEIVLITLKDKPEVNIRAFLLGGFACKSELCRQERS
jgi:hypothetical protein